MSVSVTTMSVRVKRVERGVRGAAAAVEAAAVRARRERRDVEMGDIVGSVLKCLSIY